MRAGNAVVGPGMRRTWAGAVLAVALLSACSGVDAGPASGTSAPRTSAPDASTAGTSAAGTSAAGTPGASSAAPPSGGTSTAPTSAAAAPAQPATDWWGYHRTPDRAGAVGGAGPSSLAAGWTARLDGAVYGQALVVGDLVIAATERNSVYGLARGDGTVRWHRSLGTPVRRADLPCGNIDPLGITGTPAYDPVTGSVFVATETTGAHHTLVALDARDGAVRWSTTLDVTSRDRHAEQQRGALAVGGGRVYVPFGGLAGDCGNYVGYVTATATSGRGATTRYEVPTAREGGIWAASGVAVDASGVWVAVGNGASTSTPYDGSDSVLRLSPDLSRRLDWFAPKDWGSENARDADLGSTGPLLVGGGRVMVGGKTGDVYLLDAGRLGGIGGQVTSVGGCRSFGGMAFDAATGAAYVPCQSGLARIDATGRALTVRWRAPAAVNGSPVVDGARVLTLEQAGRLHLLDAATGREVGSLAVGAVSRFASPSVSGDLVLVPTLSGVTAVRTR